MALVYADRVLETTATTGTGTYNLAGAKAGNQAFSDALSNGDTAYYTATDGTDWEVGLGTFTASGTTLARTSILDSSNGGSAVSWGAGDKDIFLTFPGAQAALADSALQSGDNISELTNNSGYITSNQTITLSGDVSGSGTNSIVVTVADDSHNHVISNVDGLQAALDAKLQNLSEDTTPQLGGNLDTNGNDIAFGDNDKATFGASNDLQIYHDGSNSFIQDAGTGQIRILGDDVRIMNAAGNKIGAQFIQDGQARLKYDNITKLATTSTGIDVTGTVTADGLTVDNGGSGLNYLQVTNSEGSSRFGTDGGFARILDGSNNLSYASNGVDQYFYTDASTLRMKLSTGGDISFYEDTGTTAKFFWDASTESLGIGTTVPSSIYSIDATKGFRITSTVPALTLQESDASNHQWQLGSYGGSFSIRDVTHATYPFTVAEGGNVGIGTSSPATKLHIAGTNWPARFSDDGTGFNLDILHDTSQGITSLKQTNSGGDIRLQAGSATGLLMFDTANSERMRIDSSGNVLVGKTAATISTVGAELRPTGEVVATTNGLNVAYFNRTSSDGSIIDLRKDGTTVGSIGVVSGTNFYINNGDTGLGFRPNGDDIVPVSSGGSGRDAAIDIGDGNFRFKDLYLSGTAYAASVKGTNLTFSGNNSTEHMRIDSAGNVGIGTSAPASFGELTVKKDQTSDTSVTVSNLGTSGASTTMSFTLSESGTPQGWFRRYRDGTGNTELGFSDNLLFSGGVTGSKAERMRIDSSGRVGIGTSSPSAKLDVSATSGSSVQIKNTGTAASLVLAIDSSQNSIYSRGATSATARDLRFIQGSSEAMRIDNAGNVGIGTASPSEKLNVSGNILATGNITAYSDERLKSDIETLDGSKVYQMRGVSYTKDGQASSGVIAQELQKVAPELVSESGEYLSVAYGNLVGYLIEAVKELKAEVEALKGEK